MTLGGSHWSRRQFFRVSLAASLVGLGAAPDRRRLRTSGRWFLDENGRVILLRGINLAGNSKVPPYLPTTQPADLDPLPALGFNVVRLLWIWEAFEPAPGQYDWSYLAAIRKVAAECWSRGLYVIIDNHQDGYSRTLANGCGDGFPQWAVSPTVHTHAPNNGPTSRDWAIQMILDPNMHASWSAFYANTHGVRTRYLEMMGIVAHEFAQEPGVIGYDLMNEPWGEEKHEIASLYEDVAAVIRAHDPYSILFVEGYIATNTGMQTCLPKPKFANFSYAPHYYKLETIATKGWHGGTAVIAKAFEHMTIKSAEWGVPLFVGEFGGPAGAARIGEYMDEIYNRLDGHIASGAQWCFTPLWNPVDKDGWNGEDFSISIPSTGQLRPNFRPRPHPVAIAGIPIRFGFIEGDSSGRGNFCEFSWEHHPERGETEVFVPRCRFPAGWRLSINDAQASWTYDEAQQKVRITSPKATILTLRITS